MPVHTIKFAVSSHCTYVHCCLWFALLLIKRPNTCRLALKKHFNEVVAIYMYKTVHLKHRTQLTKAFITAT